MRRPTAFRPMTMNSNLILKRASISRSSGQWKDEDYDVLADGKVVGHVFNAASPVGKVARG